MRVRLTFHKLTTVLQLLGCMMCGLAAPGFTNFTDFSEYKTLFVLCVSSGCAFLVCLIVELVKHVNRRARYSIFVNAFLGLVTLAIIGTLAAILYIYGRHHLSIHSGCNLVLLPSCLFTIQGLLLYLMQRYCGIKSDAGFDPKHLRPGDGREDGDDDGDEDEDGEDDRDKDRREIYEERGIQGRRRRRKRKHVSFGSFRKLCNLPARHSFTTTTSSVMSRSGSKKDNKKGKRKGRSAICGCSGRRRYSPIDDDDRDFDYGYDQRAGRYSMRELVIREEEEERRVANSRRLFMRRRPSFP